MIPFMGRESNPGIYNPFLAHKNETDTLQSVFRYPPKIFRKTYAVNPELLRLRKKFPHAEISPLLVDIRIKDVTGEYFPVSDISIKKDGYLPDEPGYLAVYGKKWEVVAIAHQSKDSIFVFHNMKRNILYIPARYENNRTIPCSYPFILQEDGNIRKLKPKKAKLLT